MAIRNVSVICNSWRSAKDANTADENIFHYHTITMDDRTSIQESNIILLDGVPHDISNLLMTDKTMRVKKLYPTDQLSSLDEGLHCERRRFVDYCRVGLSSKVRNLKKGNASGKTSRNNMSCPGSKSILTGESYGKRLSITSKYHLTSLTFAWLRSAENANDDIRCRR